jgi:hypothetical protein
MNLTFPCAVSSAGHVGGPAGLVGSLSEALSDGHKVVSFGLEHADRMREHLRGCGLNRLMVQSEDVGRVLVGDGGVFLLRLGGSGTDRIARANEIINKHGHRERIDTYSKSQMTTI